jgi:guanine deaminase
MDRNALTICAIPPSPAHDDSKATKNGMSKGARPMRSRRGFRRHQRHAGIGRGFGPSIPDCLMQTHLSEQHPEITVARALFPDARYLDTYEAFGLLAQHDGHAIHLQDREQSGCRGWRGRGPLSIEYVYRSTV